MKWWSRSGQPFLSFPFTWSGRDRFVIQTMSLKGKCERKAGERWFPIFWGLEDKEKDSPQK